MKKQEHDELQKEIQAIQQEHDQLQEEKDTIQKEYNEYLQNETKRIAQERDQLQEEAKRIQEEFSSERDQLQEESKKKKQELDLLQVTKEIQEDPSEMHPDISRAAVFGLQFLNLVLPKDKKTNKGKTTKK
ncbi:uncharacterized protein LOC127158041 isoform X1 [Labeo rohita]|uniref:uncharacterized protein LOC127158041 isoform X1 n=1 Tax=Labeo rohita TaxID=84645 RepID=UPI0021E2FB8B|nr:uncharacterized protein LOC127158041 isoform X1 [Labeo rohita]